MGGGCTGAPAEGGKEGERGSSSASRRRVGGTRSVPSAGGLGGSKDEESDAASRWKHWPWLAMQARSTALKRYAIARVPQPEGLMAKGSHAASAGLNGEPAPPCARFLPCLETLCHQCSPYRLLGHAPRGWPSRCGCSELQHPALVQRTIPPDPLGCKPASG